MNYIFISPNYPSIYANFCHELRKNGVTTLGIGDEHYENLTELLKNSLMEYYRVDSLENTQAVTDAIAYFEIKYGKIDGLESNNEYWLEKDSYYRDIFNIRGLKQAQMADYKCKSRMKKYFTLAGVPVAPYVLTRDYHTVLSFAEIEGYPIFAKPDNGVGANGTKKINNKTELFEFFVNPPTIDYIFEIYVEGELYSYDGITDNTGRIVFETCHHFLTPIDKLIESGTECIYRTLPIIPDNLKKVGRASVKEFGLKGRFFHIEFFQLTKPLNSLAKKGDFVGLEANMRIAGGLTADMITESLSINVYELWTKCVTKEAVESPVTQLKYCSNIARIKDIAYRYTTRDIKNFFGTDFIKAEKTNIDYSPFGNEEFLAVFDSEEQCVAFEKMVSERVIIVVI